MAAQGGRLRGFVAACVAGSLLAMLALAGPESPPAEADTTPRVEIYTTASCPYCKALRAYLKARGIAYTDHNINRTLETREAFYASGAYGVPLTVIDGQRIQGFDPVRIEAALKAARAAAQSAHDR
jgi:glutaredoxin